MHIEVLGGTCQQKRLVVHASSAEQHCRLPPVQNVTSSCPPLFLCQAGTACSGSSIRHACMSSAARQGVAQIGARTALFCMLSAVNQLSLTVVPTCRRMGRPKAAGPSQAAAASALSASAVASTWTPNSAPTSSRWVPLSLSQPVHAPKGTHSNA